MSRRDHPICTRERGSSIGFATIVRGLERLQHLMHSTWKASPTDRSLRQPLAGIDLASGDRLVQRLKATRDRNRLRSSCRTTSHGDRRLHAFNFRGCPRHLWTYLGGRRRSDSSGLTTVGSCVHALGQPNHRVVADEDSPRHASASARADGPCGPARTTESDG